MYSLLLFVLFMYRCFGLTFGNTTYFVNGDLLASPFPILFDLCIETEDGFMFLFLYLVTGWKGLEKKELWPLSEDAKLYYTYRGIRIKNRYLPYTPVHFKPGKGMFLHRERKRGKNSLHWKELSNYYPEEVKMNLKHYSHY